MIINDLMSDIFIEFLLTLIVMAKMMLGVIPFHVIKITSKSRTTIMNIKVCHIIY